MIGGLVHQTADGPQVTAAHTAGAGGPTGGNSQGPTATATSATGGAEASVTDTSDPTAIGAVDSHLDSFFEQHALTRNDVVVLLGIVQSVAWLTLLYLEVSNR